MRRFSRFGEGALLGVFICILMITAVIVVLSGKPAAITVKPIHEMNVNVTPEPLVNINTASAETLADLNGVGEVIAERIVEWRKENGPFETIDALLSVPGIGEAKLETIRDHVCVD